MLHNKDILAMYVEWFGKLDNAITCDLGREMCETSRMLIGVLSILQGYFPEEYTEKVRKDSLALFDGAISQLSKNIQEKRDEEGNDALYKRNISMRRETLEMMDVEGCVIQNEFSTGESMPETGLST